MAILDEFGWLGTSLQTLLFFIVSGGILTGLLALFFIRRYGINSLSFQLIWRGLWLILPLSWLGLTVGSNLARLGEISTSGTEFTQSDVIINIIVTIILSLIFSIFVLSQMNGQLRNQISILNQATARVSQGDLRQPDQFRRSSSGDIFHRFYVSYNKMLIDLQDLAKRILTASERVAGTSEEIAASTSEISSSSNSISSIMENISQGSQSQVEKVESAILAEKDLRNTLDQSFDQILESIELVQEISEETNLLALNASIEAQRAGEAGRGFAIVAQNVRRLSDDTRTYSDEIFSLINEVELKIKNAQRNISNSISDIRDVSEDVAAASEEVSASAEEQAATLQEMSAATQELAELANILENEVKRFRLD
ncbi:MAG: methyl-accepting chemotaxis protein [Candidatus Kariarchaeaceae archaeon]